MIPGNVAGDEGAGIGGVAAHIVFPAQRKLAGRNRGERRSDNVVGGGGRG